ncbi:MAG: HpcH/HpaI aldolase/citrate lyase family protein [Woeseiaceae bacterium]
MRSKLFVPGSSAPLFAKALAGHADAISVDLEDSVVDRRKSEARESVSEFLRSPEVSASNKVIVVRCNALNSDHFVHDLAAVVVPGLSLLNLPKVESSEDVLAAVAALEEAEAINNVTAPIRILATIESPKGLRQALQIATAHSRMAGLQLGLSDLFEPLGMDRNDTANIHAAMFALRMAAGHAGIFAYDGAFTDVGNPQRFRAEAELAHRLGFWGKSCIHPSQVQVANEVFAPSEQDLAFARRVLEACERAESEGVGVFMVDGRMIDLPLIRRAEVIVAASRRS